MEIWEILLIGVALSMDAFAVGMTNGMAEPKMSLPKMFAVAGMYALFQFLMPVLGYYCGSAFADLVARVAPYLSFALLVFLGGKMVFDFLRETKRGKTGAPAPVGKGKPLGAGKLLLQAVATSIDALAVGVTLLAEETSVGLPFHVVFCALVIGGVTLLLSLLAVFLGKKIGDRFAAFSGLVGGTVLIALGIKILVEGLI